MSAKEEGPFSLYVGGLDSFTLARALHCAEQQPIFPAFRTNWDCLEENRRIGLEVKARYILASLQSLMQGKDGSV